MSGRYWKGGNWYDSTTGMPIIQGASPGAKQQRTITEPADMPKSLDEQESYVEKAERGIPTGWVFLTYGIPSSGKGDQLRSELRRTAKAHGLQTTDSKDRQLKNRGGSTYIGPRTPELDKSLEQRLKDIATEFKVEDFVTLFPAQLSGLTASMFVKRIMRSALQDMEDSRKALVEFEKALSGDVKLVNPKDNEPRDLLTTGAGRIDTAFRVCDEVEKLITRFDGGALKGESETLEQKVREFRAWVKAVEAGYTKRRPELERIHKARLAAKKAEGNEEVA